MIVKFETSCAFVGTDKTHFVEFPDGTSEEEIQAYGDDLLYEDIAPEVSFEILSDEDAEEEMTDYGYTLE